MRTVRYADPGKVAVLVSFNLPDVGDKVEDSEGNIGYCTGRIDECMYEISEDWVDRSETATVHESVFKNGILKVVEPKSQHIVDVIKYHVENGTLDLDSEVHELKSVEATEINNRGIESQIHYIKERCGESYLKKLIG